jgi:hypothetical protein
MKKLVLSLCMIVSLFLIVNCSRTTVVDFHYTLVPGEHFELELDPPSGYDTLSRYIEPLHAATYELIPNDVDNSYIYFHQADTGYIGEDFVQIWIDETDYSGGAGKWFGRYQYDIFITIVEQTLPPKVIAK